MSVEIKDAYDLITSEEVEQPKLWEPFLNRSVLAMLMGSSDTGKSSWLRQLVYSVITGAKEFCGYPLFPVHKKALYITTEDGPTDVTNGLKRLHNDANDVKDLKGRLHFMFGFSNQLAELDRYLAERPVDVLVVDCFADLVKGSTNDLSTVRQAMLPLKEMARKHDCVVLLMHHSVKNAESQAPNKSLANGSQAMEAVPRLVMELRRDDNPSQRLLTVVKGNTLSGDLKKGSIVLAFDEQTLSFTKVGEKGFSSAGAMKGKYNSVKIALKLLELKKEHSFEQCREELVKQFGEENVPKITRLKDIYNETSKAVRQSLGSGDQPTDHGAVAYQLS